MIITQRDVQTLCGFLEDFENERLQFEHAAEFIALHPHLFMAPLGFDDYVPFNLTNFRQFDNFQFDSQNPIPSLFRKPTGRWLLVEPQESFFGHRISSFILAAKHARGGRHFQEILVEDLISDLQRCVKETVTDEKRLWSPRLWTPEAQEKQRVALAGSVSRIMKALHSQATSLRDLTWSQLEDVVAEVLRTLGLQIHVVRERPQGGRDLIARGELIPGQEPLEIAVEVKHKPVVGRPEVENCTLAESDVSRLTFCDFGQVLGRCAAGKGFAGEPPKIISERWGRIR